jgi:large-conductance mechanosensitive channel
VCHTALERLWAASEALFKYHCQCENVKNAILVIAAAVIGAVITLLTALINVTPSGLVGATWYGWPLAWRYNLVTYPPATTFSYLNIVADIVIWGIIAAIVLFIALKLRRR